MPSPFLIPPPAEGLARRDAGPAPDYRGLAVAFSAEPELAALLIGDAPVRPAEEDELELGLHLALRAPPLNLRQGAFAKRRQWRPDRGRLRRVALLTVALVALSLILQVATIVRYTFAADRLEAEAAALGGAPGADGPPGFSPLAAILFDSVRAIPNVELTRIDYRPDGSLSAVVQVDNPATLAIFRRHVEASGARVEAGTLEGAGPRPTAELVVRPA
jgi:general secretion pathway protein L